MPTANDLIANMPPEAIRLTIEAMTEDPNYRFEDDADLVAALQRQHVMLTGAEVPVPA